MQEDEHYLLAVSGEEGSLLGLAEFQAGGTIVDVPKFDPCAASRSAPEV